MLYIGILEVVSSLIDIYVINSFLTSFILKHLHTQFQNKEGRSYLYYFFHTFKNHANDLFLFLNWISTSLNVTCLHNYQEIYPRLALIPKWHHKNYHEYLKNTLIIRKEKLLFEKSVVPNIKNKRQGRVVKYMASLETAPVN